MADIDALRNRIRSNVKSNDNQEITGPVMQETLLDMARELDPSLEEQRAKDAEAVLSAGLATLNTGLVNVTAEVNKKPDTVNIIDYLVADAELPVASYYTYGRRPLYSISGEYANIFYIAFCMAHFNSIAPSIALFRKNAQDKYVFYSQFRADHAQSILEQHVALVFGGIEATTSTPGLMSSTDKGLLDDVVTEVFPVKVQVVSSNAGAREIGTSITPSISLGITRKGADVSDDAEVTFTPDDGDWEDNTYTGAAISSGSKTYQISVMQGGQTVSAPNQKFEFMNYRYYGVVSAAPANAAAVKTLCQNGTLSKQLSNSTTLGDTELAANKYYVFVIPNTSVNLVVKNAKSGNTISGCTVGTVEIPRVNGSANVNYKYVIVPASSISWTFKITNS